MCVVSMVSDHYLDKWRDMGWHPNTDTFAWPQVSRQEFDDLKRQVEEMHELLKRAKEYDRETGQPDCEMDLKVDALRQIAELFRVDLSDVFGESG